MAQKRDSDTTSIQDWQVLRTLCWFRLLLCVAFAYALPQVPSLSVFNDASQTPYIVINALYAVVSLILPILLQRRIPSFSTQVSMHVFSDLLVISLIVITVDSLTQTVASLLCIPLAEAVLLRRAKLLYPLAALTAATVLATDLLHNQFQAQYLSSGALSLAFVAVAYLGRLHIRRIEHIDNALREQHQEVSSLTNLAEEILDASTQGLIVVDNDNQVRFINATAIMLLGCESASLPSPVATFSSALDAAVTQRADVVKDDEGSVLLRLHISALRGGNTLIALMDMREIEAMTEQIRLASLGRWSASVAHEIRNPLSAVSQAIQLLEDEDLSAAHRNIVNIMQRNTARIDAVVKDVLTLSRPNAQDQSLSLQDWVHDFQHEFKATRTDAHVTVSGSLHDGGQISVDEKRLYQILNNLCENALVHGNGNDLHIALESTETGDSPEHRLRVSNRGAPMTEAQQRRMFEPFFTTSTRGSGLGLFVVRELCEHLGFKLEYHYEGGQHHITLTTSHATQSARQAA